jgi:hypothetical protein
LIGGFGSFLPVSLACLSSHSIDNGFQGWFQWSKFANDSEVKLFTFAFCLILLKMLSTLVVVLVGLFAVLTAANETPANVNTVLPPLSMQSMHRQNIEAMKNAFKNRFELTAETTEDVSALRGPVLEVESTSAVKYLNLFGYSDDSCSDLSWSMYLPLDYCLPNAWGVTDGNFVKWHCNADTLKCWVRGYTKHDCKTAASGTRYATGTLPSTCTTDLGFSSAYYSLSATMPYHTSGLMTKIYRARDCTGVHVTYYTPNGVCFDVESDTADTVSFSYNCATGVINYWPYTYSCMGYSEFIPVQDWNSQYDTCTRYTEDFDDFSVSGGSEMDICGGVIV